MSDQRQNFYTIVHKGIRRQLSEVLTLAGTIDFEDARQRQLFSDRFDALAGMLEAHAHHEDKHIGPFIERAAAELNRRIVATHRVLEDTMEEMQGILALIHREPHRVRVLGYNLYLAFARYAATQFDHMHEEESAVMGALWSAFDDATLEAIHQAVLADIPPQEMSVWLSWMVPSMTPPEQQGMIADMKKGAPPQVLSFVEQLAVKGQGERESRLQAA